MYLDNIPNVFPIDEQAVVKSVKNLLDDIGASIRNCRERGESCLHYESVPHGMQVEALEQVEKLLRGKGYNVERGMMRSFDHFADVAFTVLHLKISWGSPVQSLIDKFNEENGYE